MIGLYRHFVLAVFLVLVLAPAPASSAGTWLRDSESNCAIWNAEPRADESFSWTGGCEAGLATGEGTLQWV